MELKFTVHSRARLTERNLSVDHIKKAIREPDIKEAAYEGAIRVRKAVDGRTIEVVYLNSTSRGKKEAYVIVTAYYIGKPQNQ
jgi:Domain of unknown function (DUF4258)